VVRHGEDGIGFNFVLKREEERKALKRFMRNTAKLGEAGDDRGQALVEFALTVPLLFFLIVLTVNFGGWLYSWIEIGNSVRAAADYASLGVSSAGDPTTATGTTLVNLINADLAKLPNRTTSNPSVYICQNDGTNITALTGTCPSSPNAPVADPEAPAYVAVTVDVTFTYTPFFLAFNFPSLGIGLPTIPSAIHKRAVMRILN
jgi:Flp pilus assembly protein TadG